MQSLKTVVENLSANIQKLKEEVRDLKAKENLRKEKAKEQECLRGEEEKENKTTENEEKENKTTENEEQKIDMKDVFLKKRDFNEFQKDFTSTNKWKSKMSSKLKEERDKMKMKKFKSKASIFQIVQCLFQASLRNCPLLQK